MSKIAIITASTAFMVLLGFISTLSLWNHNLSKKNAELKERIANYATLLETQNKALEKQKLDTESYKKQASQAREKIITRYQTITTPTPESNTCEQELESIKQALSIFYKGGRESKRDNPPP